MSFYECSSYNCKKENTNPKVKSNKMTVILALKVIPMSLLVNLHKISAMILLLKTFQQKETFNSFMLLEKHYFVTEGISF